MRKCPECGELKLKRLIGAGAAVVFKGSGFYQTDYRSESYKKRAAEETSSSSSAKTDKASRLAAQAEEQEFGRESALRNDLVPTRSRRTSRGT